MKILLVFTLLISSNALATIYCQVPYGYPDSFKSVQKIAISDEKGSFSIIWPKLGPCKDLTSGNIACSMEVSGSDYLIEVNPKLAGGSEFQVAGKITKIGFWKKRSEIYCKTQ